MTDILACPCIGPGSTPKGELLRQITHAIDAVIKARAALTEAAPAASDYAVGPWRIETAQEQHRSRLAALDVVVKHLAIVAVGIDQQETVAAQ